MYCFQASYTLILSQEKLDLIRMSLKKYWFVFSLCLIFHIRRYLGFMRIVYFSDKLPIDSIRRRELVDEMEENRMPSSSRFGIGDRFSPPGSAPSSPQSVCYTLSSFNLLIHFYSALRSSCELFSGKPFKNIQSPTWNACSTI